MHKPGKSPRLLHIGRRNMKKKILIVFSVLLAIVAVGAGTYEFYVKPKYVRPLVVAVEQFLLEDEELVGQLVEEYEKSLLEDGLAEALETEVSKMETEQITSTTENMAPSKENNDQPSIEPQANEIKDLEEQPKKETKKKASKKTVIGGKTMDELESEIAPNDLKAGLKIVSKLDTGHLLGLTKGGFTPENKKAAKAYLDSRLTPGEFSQLKGFVGKYAYLLK